MPTPTIASPPSTSDIAFQELAYLAAQSGVMTDYNVGSNIRTFAEALGSVIDIQSNEMMALALQAIVYGAMSAFGISPLGASSATGYLLFATSLGSSPPAASQAVSIPVGTICQTAAGVQVQTLSGAVIASGSSSVSVPAVALVAGSLGNISASGVSFINTALSYPLQVTNPSAFSGGSNAELPAQTLARLAAKIASIGLSTPVSIANAAIGVVASGTNETVRYASCYEGWVVSGNTTAGFDIYIDNGTGYASSGLISAVSGLVDGLQTGTSGYRPAGVPWNVFAVNPVSGSVGVVGTLIYSQYSTQISAAITTAIANYQSGLLFNTTAEAPQLTAVVANAVAGYVSGLEVTLYNSSMVSVSGVVASGAGQRVILTALTPVLS